MKKKRNIFGIILSAVVLAGLGTGFVLAQAPLTMPENELVLEGKKPARFPHAPHAALGMECSVCHHDQNHEPLTAEGIAAIGDAVQLQCQSCHNKEFSKEEFRKAKDVFHARCKTCHKEGYAGKNGPNKCSGCHLKKKKKAVEGC